MKNVLLWGLDNEIMQDVFFFLEKERKMSIKVWFGESSIERVTHNWLEVVGNGLGQEEISQCDKIIYQQMYPHLYSFMEMLSYELCFQNKAVHEYLNIFNLLLNYFYQLIDKNKINMMIFEDIPHGAPNYILYNLAKIMKIKTLIVSQSIFPNRFLHVHDMEDFGLFEIKTECNLNRKKIELLKLCEKENCHRSESIDKEYQTIVMQKEKKWKPKKLAYKKKILLKSMGIKGYIEQLVCDKLLNYQQANDYQRNRKIHFKEKIDLRDKFIYFPLQAQEEMKTAVVSDMYCDQLLAIERLSSLIPKDWYIYVQENPTETKNMRGKIFFERLKSIANVKTIGLEYSSFDLVTHSQLIGTITGMVGWEAICRSKNVIVFGRPWYLSLPGVFSYTEGLSLQNVLKYKINQEDLQERLTLLLNKMDDGIINPDFISATPNFNQQGNKEQLIEFFQSVLFVHM